MPGEKRATSADVARRAGVSRATVSYVLNCVPHKSITEETRKRVLRAAAELDYVPNSAARRLKTNRAYRIAVRLATALTSPRYYETLQGIRSFVEPLGYTILLCNDRAATRQSSYIDACRAGEADGIIYIAADHEGLAPAELEEIHGGSIPLSAVDCMGDTEDVCSVTYDYARSSSVRVRFALDRGITRFWYLRPDFDNEKERLREEGFRVTASQGGAHWFIGTYPGTDRNQSTEDGSDAGRTPDEVWNLVRAWVAEAPLDTCFICSSPGLQDVVSGLLYERHLLGAGDGAIPWELRSPSYRYDHFAAGREAAQSLIDAIDGGSGARRLVMEPALVLPRFPYVRR